MTKEPKNNTLSDRELEMLAKIFRLILPEIKNREDAERLLAPGELGISYKDGTFYAKNPHNGKIFSPNSMEPLRIILSKFDPGTTILNADRISGLNVYHNLIDLDKIDARFTPDSVIRQIHAPGIFIGPVEYSNGVELGWPSNYGFCFVVKEDEGNAYISFYDNDTGVEHIGQYHRIKHQFMGWVTGGQICDYRTTIRVIDDIGHMTLNTELRDLMVIFATMESTLPAGSGISVNGLDPKPLVNIFGQPINYPISENNDIMLIYDETNDRFVVLETTDSALHYLITILANRLDDKDKAIHDRLTDTDRRINDRIDDEVKALTDQFNTTIKNLTESFNNTISEMKKYYDQKIAHLEVKPGNIYRVVTDYVAPEDGITAIKKISGFDSTSSDVLQSVNYGQTILKPGVDYQITGDGIEFINGMSLKTGDTIQFVIFKQE